MDDYRVTPRSAKEIEATTLAWRDALGISHDWAPDVVRLLEVRVPKLGRVDKLNPDADGGKQHECGEALGQFVVAGGDPT
jgi:hypothetical protein